MDVTQKPKKWSSGTVGLLAFGGVIGGLILTSPPPPSAPQSQSQDSRNTGSDADWDSGTSEDVRNQYASKAECVEDYSEAECKASNASSGGGFFYFGPWYRSNWRTNPVAGASGPGRYARLSETGLPAPGVKVAGASPQVQRGGFGATGRSYSSRGG